MFDDTISYTNARAHLKELLDKVTTQCANILINRRNGDDVVVMPRDEYESIMETFYLMSSNKNHERITHSINHPEEMQKFKNVKELESSILSNIKKKH